jgi:small-conductance mechanosensitive channel
LDFGDNGVQFVAKFWVDGLDEGKNSFNSTIRFAVWDALKAAGIRMPKQVAASPLVIDIARKGKSKA